YDDKDALRRDCRRLAAHPHARREDFMSATPSIPSLADITRPQSPTVGDQPVKIDAQRLNFFYGSKRALHEISIQLRANLVSALIGPSGCGKSTFLRTLNRMNDIIP